MTTEASDIADGIVPESRPEHIEPSRTTFRPWHKVRKQFIRKHQWNELVKRHVNDAWRTELQRPSATPTQSGSSMHVSRPLRCLIIPGDDLLDMRSLWNDISHQDCFIHYLGFNDGHGSDEVGTSVHVANNGVTSLAGVLPDSHVLRDRFEAIASTNSLAYRCLGQYGPFHLVNLDLCGSMFPNTEKSVEPYFKALHKLLEYQFAKQKTNWLLLITTIVKPTVVDIEGMQQLCKPTRENFDTNVSFAEKLAELLPRASLEGGDSSVGLGVLSEEEVIRLFGVALGKWLLRIALSASPKWTVGMRRSFQYGINEEHGAVMLSLAFEMIPHIAPPVDATGMSTLSPTVKTFQSEATSAVKLVESVSNITDVDAKLSESHDLFHELLNESADLLASAGYDRDAYLRWVNDDETTGMKFENVNSTLYDHTDR